MSRRISQKAGNLELEPVNEEIENALELYPDKISQKNFAVFQVYQVGHKLIDYVISQTLGDYTFAEDLQKRSAKLKSPYLFPEPSVPLGNSTYNRVTRQILRAGTFLIKHPTYHKFKLCYLSSPRFGRVFYDPATDY